MSMYPLVRQMLAIVHNNTMLCTAPGFSDLLWYEVKFPESQPLEQLAIAESILVKDNSYIELMSAGTVPDDQLPAVLVAVCNNYCHSIGFS